ncbi:hypothetical protein [Phenylobacterium montanum]|uniref:Uncharacterized protein n=1 Tax=Phenylobacterium montanum TaxID=2823693 RepID=A0A975G4D5_9CAUL|nr:hypothetical protein [Caulobacter sp. S6]QUD90574.1 hypothetical protein KCG34_12235 [Caulobacter sp. S6]
MKRNRASRFGTIADLDDGFEVQGVLPLDTAWNIANAIKNDLIDTAVITCDSNPDRGQTSVLRSIAFRSGMAGAK